MSTLKVDTLQTTGGAGLYPARAWLNFNGSGTVAIRASGNVSSITDDTTGQYTASFSSSLPSANYTMSGTTNSMGSDSSVCTFGPRAASRAGALTNYTSSAVRFNCGGKHNYAVSSDGSFVGIQVFV